MDQPLEITPQAAQQQLSTQQNAIVIDVREPEEFALARLDPSELIPLNTIPGELDRIKQVSAEGPVFVLCHHGVRSLQAAHWLRRQGVDNCFSVAGGIDRWSIEVDRDIPRY